MEKRRRFSNLIAILFLAGLVWLLWPLIQPGFAQRGREANDWKREHSGHPYVGAEVHFVLDFGPNIGHPRPAIVTRVYEHQRADLVVFLSAKDFIDSVTVATSALPVLGVEEAAPDSSGNPGTWHWPPDPKEYRSTGQ